MSDRRAKGLCYFCDEPFTPEHGLSHKTLQLHVMEVDELQEGAEEEVSLENSTGSSSIDPQIFVHALMGIANFHTMRVTGYHQKKPLHVLIDNGSTHNFLDIEVAKRLGCKSNAFDSLSMVVADGTQLNVFVVVRGFQWGIQQTKFTSDMLLIPLGCCDLVLGVEWLVFLGDIVWNFNKLQMEFYVKGRRHVLRGASTGLKTVKRQQLGKAMSTGVHLSILQVCDGQRGFLNSFTTQAVDKEVPPTLAKLLDEFSDLFQEPSGLPPRRPGHDHRIPLVQGVGPISSSIFSKIDLRSRYNQVRMDPADVYKTAFKTHAGHFEYLVMPFGLTNAPATFEGLMNLVFKEFLRKFMLVFFDDILVYRCSLEDHLLHLHKVLATMRANSLFAKRTKLAFQQLKKKLTETPVLALPDCSKTFVVEVDASGLGIGAVLMQDHHSIAYISRHLNHQQ
ncbi:uncharacterized protein [Glycine max]|uniref:uncharacterized protein n=1 Tax=Glycine max TaxID=3847 RepID=UPI0007191D80|nr:uncharacterized protein LOC106799303 [Glycine max]